jgi:glycosyltransferase involved in cell wall biosynthesis
VRVLVVSNFYPPHAPGGYELSCRDVMDRFAARGHAVEVLTTRARTSDEQPSTAPVPGVRAELEWWWYDHEFVRPSLPGRLRAERANAAVLRRAVREFRPTVVSAWGMGGMPMSLLTRCGNSDLPLVLAVCDEWPVYGPRVDAWMSAWASRPVAARVVHRLTGLPTRLPRDLDATALYVSDALRDTCETTAEVLRPTRGDVVYSGIDPVDFPSRDPEDREWSGRLLAVGRIEPRKGFDVAIRALALLPQATLRLLGHPDPRHLGSLLDLAAELGVADRVRVDRVDRSSLAAEYAAADAVVFPSRWPEPFGLVPVEAMSQATPVVATALGGSAEFLDDGRNCLVVAPDDPHALAAAVARLADDPALRRRLASGGRVTADSLGVDRLADVMEAWHVAAESRFRDGEPAHRPLPAPPVRP